MNRLRALALIALGSAPAWGAGAPSPMACAPEGILAAVAGRMGVGLRPEIPLPRLRRSSDTPLIDFQDAIEHQWGFRPGAFTNAYAAARNEIFLLDDPDYYRRMGRFPEDSLAHEFVHYFQVRYLGARLEEDSDYLESQAVAVQTWFRERFIDGGSQGLCGGGPSGSTSMGPKSLADSRRRGHDKGMRSVGGTMIRANAAAAAALISLAAQVNTARGAEVGDVWSAAIPGTALEQLLAVAPGGASGVVIPDVAVKKSSEESQPKPSPVEKLKNPCSAWEPILPWYASADKPLTRADFETAVVAACAAAGGCSKDAKFDALAGRSLASLGLDKGRARLVFWDSLQHGIEGHNAGHQASRPLAWAWDSSTHDDWTLSSLTEALFTALRA